jgi:hypothetical protein
VRCDFARKVLFGAPVDEEDAELGNDSSPMRHVLLFLREKHFTTPAIWRQHSISSLNAFSAAPVMVSFSSFGAQVEIQADHTGCLLAPTMLVIKTRPAADTGTLGRIGRLGRTLSPTA